MKTTKIENLLTRPHSASHKRDAQGFSRKHQLNKTHDKYSIGDKITFWAGYNDDIRYMSEIIGIGEDGEIYVIWDCFWSPIRDDARRSIQLLSN